MILHACARTRTHTRTHTHTHARTHLYLYFSSCDVCEMKCKTLEAWPDGTELGRTERSPAGRNGARRGGTEAGLGRNLSPAGRNGARRSRRDGTEPGWTRVPFVKRRWPVVSPTLPLCKRARAGGYGQNLQFLT